MPESMVINHDEYAETTDGVQHQPHLFLDLHAA